MNDTNKDARGQIKFIALLSQLSICGHFCKFAIDTGPCHRLFARVRFIHIFSPGQLRSAIPFAFERMRFGGLRRIFFAGVLGWLSLCGLPITHAAELPFNDLRRNPDHILVITSSNQISLTAGPDNSWRASGVTVSVKVETSDLLLELDAPEIPIKHVEVDWGSNFPSNAKFLGDAWERAYGDLEWKTADHARVLPWYFLVSDGLQTHGYGVKTGAGALCSWSVRPNAVVLRCDVRSGGVGVELGKRTLTICSVVARKGQPGETPFAAAQAFCRVMCSSPRLPPKPVYGFNDWYCAYGNDTAEEFLKDTANIASLSPTNNPPFALIDDGWQVKGEKTAAPWSRTNPHFSSSLSMAEVAQRIREAGARPGIWVRPLQAYPNQPAAWRLSRDSHALDPTVPEVREYIRQTISRLRDWHYEIIKHDFTTEEITGLWGKDMLHQMTADGWAFADRSHTTAEVILDLYHDIRNAAGDHTLIIGCNTIGHLAAGIFEMQRIGDDTSGREWERTRKMGVNCLAFRAPQHGTFFAIDADCAGQSATDSTIPWSKNEQWLKLLSRSGTPCFLSFPREVITPDRVSAVREALAAAAQPQTLAEPLDWMQTRSPAHWKLDGRETDFSW